MTLELAANIAFVGCMTIPLAFVILNGLARVFITNYRRKRQARAQVR